MVICHTNSVQFSGLCSWNAPMHTVLLKMPLSLYRPSLENELCPRSHSRRIWQGGFAFWVCVAVWVSGCLTGKFYVPGMYKWNPALVTSSWALCLTSELPFPLVHSLLELPTKCIACFPILLEIMQTRICHFFSVSGPPLWTLSCLLRTVVSSGATEVGTLCPP